MEINYRGDLLAPSGYARAIRAHMRGLIEAGVTINGEINQHDQTQLGDELCETHPFWKDHMPGIIERQGQSCMVKIWHETPEFFQPDPTQYNIAYTVWETSRIIDYDLDENPRLNWVRQMNRMDEIWTAAQFEADVFRKCGVKVPVHVFPHPLDLERYTPEPPEGEFIMSGQTSKDKMVFLSVFQFVKRKNPHDLLLAWTSEFARQEDVALVIKTYGSAFRDNSEITRYVQEMRKAAKIPGLVRNLHVILDLIPEDDMPDLFRMCDCFVLPTYGEGFGMPYQEAMGCGKPVIYTNASSMPEFCVGYPIECDPEPVYGMTNIPWYNASQDWWKVRVSSLRRAMRKAYDEWKSGEIKARGQAARQVVEAQHSYAVVGGAMRTRLEEIAELIRDGSCRPELASIWKFKLDPLAEVPDTSAE